MMKRRSRRGAQWLRVLAMALLALLWVESVKAQPVPPVGTVTASTGQTSVLRFGADSPAELAVGAALFEGDEVRTADGRIRIELEDGSILQLGEDTTLTLTWVLNAPALGTQSVILAVSSGIIRTIVEALLPRSIFEVQTRTAITSVRGTDFIAEAKPDTTAVVALEGTVVVRNAATAIARPVTLDPGEGTDVAADAPPTTPARWGEARRSDFIARTTVQ
jgi:hypothetical protein